MVLVEHNETSLYELMKIEFYSKYIICKGLIDPKTSHFDSESPMYGFMDLTNVL